MRILVTGLLGYIGAVLRRDRSSSAVGAPVTYGPPVRLFAKISRSPTTLSELSRTLPTPREA
jgi:hypothetical protein